MNCMRNTAINIITIWFNHDYKFLTFLIDDMDVML